MTLALKLNPVSNNVLIFHSGDDFVLNVPGAQFLVPKADAEALATYIQGGDQGVLQGLQDMVKALQDENNDLHNEIAEKKDRLSRLEK